MLDEMRGDPHFVEAYPFLQDLCVFTVSCDAKLNKHCATFTPILSAGHTFYVLYMAIVFFYLF